ncbi:hypothetical protein EI94DRAFT_1714310 [Lactarius quietus]|nr:hypothetical protein EI94DRAFT_1757045 [Lactarius quietus]KAF8257866.1 hypothetical protein EI94DRAFT_1756485 [Lactarius quietus]KAF8274365.1 hypothetical protein EI94DRAFT_1714310 [Lactarius quietus]
MSQGSQSALLGLALMQTATDIKPQHYSKYAPSATARLQVSSSLFNILRKPIPQARGYRAQVHRGANYQGSPSHRCIQQLRALHCDCLLFISGVRTTANVDHSTARDSLVGVSGMGTGRTMVMGILRAALVELNCETELVACNADITHLRAQV